MPGTAWWTCRPLSETLSLNGPRPARIIRVTMRVTMNVTTNTAKHTNSGNFPPPPMPTSTSNCIDERSGEAEHTLVVAARDTEP